MKLIQDQFNKLKQLDRIEYRQKEDRIRNFAKTKIGGKALKVLGLWVILYILLIPQGYLVWGIEFVNDATIVFKAFFIFFMTASIFGFLIDIVFNLIRNKNIKELNEQYFKIEVKR